jgi:hypothetical protein
VVDNMVSESNLQIPSLSAATRSPRGGLQTKKSGKNGIWVLPCWRTIIK